MSIGLVNVVSPIIELYVSTEKKCWIRAKLTGCRMVIVSVLLLQLPTFAGINNEFVLIEHKQGICIRQNEQPFWIWWPVGESNASVLFDIQVDCLKKCIPLMVLYCRLGSGNCILNVYLPYHYKIKLRYNWEQLETTENSKRCSVCSRYFESEEAKR